MKTVRIFLLIFVLSSIIQISAAEQNKEYICIDKGETNTPPLLLISKIDISKIDISKIDISKIDISKIDISKIDETEPLCVPGKVPKPIVSDELNKKLDNKIKGFPDHSKAGKNTESGIQYADCSSWTACYDWADSRQLIQNAGVYAYLTQNNPTVDSTNGYHSIVEIGVNNQSGIWPGNYVESGWRKVANDVPRLFVFWWKDGVPQCYNNYCEGWKQVSGKYYPGMSLNADGSTILYAIQYRWGDWWVWYKDEWIGYYPSSLWSNKFTAGELALYYGEVASKTASTITDMGNGNWASSSAAAKIMYPSYLSSSGWNIANTVKYESTRNLYTIEPLYAGQTETIRYGGPGLDGFSSLDLVRPNGGEVINEGFAHSIDWNYEGSAGPYLKIELYKGGVLKNTIADGIKIGENGYGWYWWTPSTTLPTGNDYKIKMTSSSNPLLYNDESENYFTIIRPTITVTSPNGGEVWARSSTKTIKWNYKGTVGSYVKIELLKSGIVKKVIAKDVVIGNNGYGSYKWYIPWNQTTGKDYKIRITSSLGFKDASNNNFTITYPYITVVSPNGGEYWKRGTTQPIKWKKDGDVGSYVKIELLKGNTVNKIISSSTPNIGSYNWSIPSTQAVGNNYKIRINSTTKKYTDTSNGNFTIYS